MAKARRKIIQAGRLWMAVQYTAIRGGNQSAKREAKAMISTPAREALNAKLSWQKLMLVLAANFVSQDLVVTLTYRDGSLPPRREDADRLLSNFIRALRASRKADGKDLIYVRITEGYHTGGRFHHHLIINSSGNDFDTIRQLWKHGDNVDFEAFGGDGAERWAKYLTKEPRIQGRKYVGDRTWRTSVHMKKPSHSYSFVDADDDLSPPAGAWITDKTQCDNCYGRFCHMMAILPEQTQLNI